ncbi:hypothetical protein P170DRAFT_380058 [Aspergillus steynii IBT 23096]|uniref:Zn(2)-C6 fungal-type domain-containing protein n=1 Tax=Aspergillus steynii IBT 23096 TaxID=1392250 RepID=A0A2I2GKH9_9EURO|nr:uncharacterized protein P170DRAFT_380058 [Aspergillus steynii IBT 23096]PLB53384.1 hypothetical protein P170DRAFT_380058 [Aspergillus steynii IBT 23096]
MTRTTSSRSRTGCIPCRRKHQKCDEQRPICSFCSFRGMQCQYPSGLKWMRQTEPMTSRHRPRAHRAGALSVLRSPAPFADTFRSTEEKAAWEYYTRLVSSNVPALDGPENPYRKLSITALSSPILLETIICIATEHMLNFGLGSVPVAAERQQRMLRSIRQSLLTIEPGQTHTDPTHEACLAAVVLQGIVVAQRPDGVVEPHIKCASFLMHALGYFNDISNHNPLARMTAQRFAMVDLMLAISRQRRPFSPVQFVLHQPDEARWDGTEPSFYEMTGCPQPLMCFLVRIAYLACDVDDRLDANLPIHDILNQAFTLETELRAWNTRYTGLVPDELPCPRSPLDILSECFYWTAHLLLARRVFRDPTRSPRVQYLAHTCFRLMDHLPTGCGPDSSLPQPFYLAAREAITVEDRNWVRGKHEAMTAYYREQQRHSAMELTERIWARGDELRGASTSGDNQSVEDRFVRDLDRGSSLFIF